MKIIVLLLAVFALICSAAAVKNDVCALPRCHIGVCRAMYMHWTYIADSNECVEFMYGGCGGSKNRFITQAECEETCKE